MEFWQLLLLVWYRVSCEPVGDAVVEYHIKPHVEKTPCTYFESDRYTHSAPGLVNCSWYTTNACCKRTEVTSVFADMYPLYGATKDCRNRMNYMMCYFCSPYQMIWYKDSDKRVHICSEFCDSLYKHCAEARYDGGLLGEHYRNGSSFCEAQNFYIVEGEDNCFNFDPTVFDRASLSHSQWSLIGLALTMLFLGLWK